MTPDSQYITIETDEKLIEQFIKDIILLPRLNILKWSRITKQSPALKLGYVSQYLASLITGVEGKRSAARGDDLSDGTEVKACNRIDQLDTCKSCKKKVSRYEDICSHCGSDEIKRMEDSKWLITIRSADELNLYTNKINRLVFIIMHYPKFKENNFDEISIQAFEIWPKDNLEFQTLLKDYYYSIYCDHIAKEPSKTPAPKNFWPFTFQFYKCKPRKIYDCTITNINSHPNITTNLFISPDQDRSQIEPERVPLSILNEKEQKDILESLNINNFGEDKFIPASYLDYIQLRDTAKAIQHAKPYSRR